MFNNVFQHQQYRLEIDCGRHFKILSQRRKENVVEKNVTESNDVGLTSIEDNE